MAVFARFMGWLAVAVGVVAAILPFAVENALEPGDAILIAFVGVFAGVGLVVLANVLAIAEKIEEHTNWFSASARPSAQTAQDGSDAEGVAAGSRADRKVERAAVSARGESKYESDDKDSDTADAGTEEGPDTAARRPERQVAPVPVSVTARPTASAPDVPVADPEVYDSAKHPPAIEEWAYEDLRVMTLQDASVAVELDGVWYRFASVEDMVAYLSPQPGQ